MPKQGPQMRALAVAFGLAAMLLLAALAVFVHLSSRWERECIASWKARLARRIRASLPEGSTRSQVNAFVQAEGWELVPLDRPQRMVARDFTYCGLGSADRFAVRFRLTSDDRLDEFEVDVERPDLVER